MLILIVHQIGFRIEYLMQILTSLAWLGCFRTGSSVYILRRSVVCQVKINNCIAQVTAQITEKCCKRQITQKRVNQRIVYLKKNQKNLSCNASYQRLRVIVKFLGYSQQRKISVPFICKELYGICINLERQRPQKVNQCVNNFLVIKIMLVTDQKLQKRVTQHVVYIDQITIETYTCVLLILCSIT